MSAFILSKRDAQRGMTLTAASLLSLSYSNALQQCRAPLEACRDVVSGWRQQGKMTATTSLAQIAHCRSPQRHDCTMYHAGIQYGYPSATRRVVVLSTLQVS